MTSYVERCEKWVHENATTALANLEAWKEEENTQIISAARERMLEAYNKAWFKVLHTNDTSDVGVKKWMHESWDDSDLYRVSAHYDKARQRLQALVSGTDPLMIKNPVRLSTEDSVTLEKWLQWSLKNGS